MKNILYKALPIVIVGMSAIVLANVGFFYARVNYWLEETGWQVISDNPQVASKEIVEYEPGRLIIPSLGIHAPIVFPPEVDEKFFQEYLTRGVVHYPGTANAGEVGNAYFFGHSSDYVWKKHAYKNVFALLPEIALGEVIIVTDSFGKSYEYRVNEKFIASPKDMALLKQGFGGERIITLQTSYPLGTAAKRFIVRGILP